MGYLLKKFDLFLITFLMHIHGLLVHNSSVHMEYIPLQKYCKMGYESILL